MHMCLIASSVKIITIKHIGVVYRFKSPGWLHVETYMHVVGLRCSNTAGAIKRVRRSMIGYKIVSSCTDYVLEYKACNILYLNK